MGLETNKVTNANVYDGAKSLLGKINEFELPNLEYMHGEHNALGMVGIIETFSGVAAMEATARVNSIYPEIIDAFSNPTVTKKLQLRTSLEVWTSNGREEEQPVIVFLSVRPANFPLGNFTPKENVELEYNLKVTSVKLVVNGVEKFEFDAENNILKVNGEDILANYRQNIGG